MDKRSRSRSPSTAEDGLAKRQRASIACEQCRVRKLACSGEQPCGRCRQEAKQCIFVSKERRTPLTRTRMTELENQLDQYERLWDEICPGWTMTAAALLREREGCTAVKSELLSRLGQGSLAHSVHPHTASHHPAPVDDSAAPSRQESPAHPSVPPPWQPSIQASKVYEWNEATDPATVDAGMASLAADSEGGPSYLGLSSGATFLKAIRRLAPPSMNEASPLRSLVGGEFDMTWLGLGGGDNSSSGFHWTSSGPSTLERPFIPPLREVLPLVDSYFSYFHQLTPLVHEPTVRAQIMGALPITTAGTGSEVLLNMIFAMGALDAATTDDPLFSDNGAKYYESARQALERDILGRGSLTLVQGLAIMANYLQRSNRPDAGYIVLGWAIRMSMALGLHTSTVGEHCSPLEREGRIRTWWALVTLEAGCSVTFGRPNAIGPLPLHAVPLPLNTSDEYLTVSTPISPVPSDHATLYTALLVQSQLAKVTMSIHDKILQSRSPTLDHVKRYDDRVSRLLDSLPPYMTNISPSDGDEWCLARSIQIWRARDFRTILYRPILLAAAWDKGNTSGLSPSVRMAIETCRQLALANLNDIHTFVSRHVNHARGQEWYALFFAFQASLTILISVVWEPHHTQVANWKAVLTQTAGWFRTLQSMSRLANSYASLLERLANSAFTPLTGDVTGILPLDERSAPWLNTSDFLDQSTLDVDRLLLEIWDASNTQVDVNHQQYDPFGMTTPHFQ